mgnify:CR=1 FL=1
MYDGTDKPFDWAAVEDNQYNPVKKVLDHYTQDLIINGESVVQERFEYRIDSYYEIGFVSVAGLTEEEYNKILAWEKETGLKVLYPIVDTTNEQYFNPKNKDEVYQDNYWYMHDSRNNPIDPEGNVLTLEQIQKNGLYANYRYGYNEVADGEYVCDGKNYYLISEMTTEEIASKAILRSMFKKDSKGTYAFVDGNYVPVSSLTDEEKETYTDRYKWNYEVSATGEYVLDGATYKKEADLSTAELAKAYARYTPTFEPAAKGQYILHNGEYKTFKEMNEETGMTVIAWDMIAEKYSASFVLDDNGAYVDYNGKFVLESSLTSAQLKTLVRRYVLNWNDKAPGTHMYSNGEYVSVVGLSAEEIVELMPKYNKDLMMFKRTGAGGKYLTVRVLYYNYYQYLNDKEPMFLFGADAQGYDIFTRLANGARLSFILSIVVVILNLSMGIIYGSIQGYYGGKVDMIMLYLTEILGGVPTIILVTLFKMHFVDTGKISQLSALILAFAALGWIADARAVRMQFYRFKGQEYVLAARTLGANDLRLIFKHIFPNAIGTLITGWAFVIPGVIGMETTYSYLGIINFNGTSMTSIGTMLANGQAAGIDRFPHIVLFPALILGLLMIAFNLFGNGLRDAFNPSLRGSED